GVARGGRGATAPGSRAGAPRATRGSGRGWTACDCSTTPRGRRGRGFGGRGAPRGGMQRPAATIGRAGRGTGYCPRGAARPLPTTSTSEARTVGAREGDRMRRAPLYRWLAALPALLILIGAPFADGGPPQVRGPPVLPCCVVA